MTSTVIINGARTAIGRMSGAFASVTAPELGGAAIAAALDRSGVDPASLDAALLGNVVQAGVGPNPARIAALAGGVPMQVPSTTINKLCLSGLTAIAQGDAFIRAGQYRRVLAGGLESMTGAPYLARGARAGFKYGAVSLEDALERDALICAIDGEVMGLATEKYQARFGFTREQLDAYAVLSNQRAAAAIASGRFAEEIVPVTARVGRKEIVVDTDEGVRADTTLESLAKLRPAFSKDGIVTAGSSSQLSDGAAAVILMDKDEAQRQGLEWIAEIISYGTVAGPDPSLVLQPANAIADALSRTDGLTVADLELIEINEAFAGVALASMRDLDVTEEKVNVNGGAIALGHPVGMSGARLVYTLALELAHRGGGYGVAALCGGGGQGDALVIKV